MEINVVVEGDSKLLSEFPWPLILKLEKINLITEYESVTQRVLLPIESVLQNA
jgi:hypothetical protein